MLRFTRTTYLVVFPKLISAGKLNICTLTRLPEILCQKVCFHTQKLKKQVPCSEFVGTSSLPNFKTTITEEANFLSRVLTLLTRSCCSIIHELLVPILYCETASLFYWLEAWLLDMAAAKQVTSVIGTPSCLFLAEFALYKTHRLPRKSLSHNAS